MSSTFSYRLCAGSAHYFSPELERRGVRHGFLGKPLNFAKEQRVESSRQLVDTFGAFSLAIVDQVHGTEIAELPLEFGTEPFAKADGIIFSLRRQEPRLMVGIRTADCIPLLLVGREFAAVIHAGWRGLAAGIIEKGAMMLRDRGERQLLGLIGPCAGPHRYEVGEEVITALGGGAVFVPHDKGKAFLNLTQTAVGRLNQVGVSEVHDTDICTISDSRFHSFRRDKEAVGNNLLFVLIGG